jgi:hypothetical protein
MPPLHLDATPNYYTTLLHMYTDTSGYRTECFLQQSIHSTQVMLAVGKRAAEKRCSTLYLESLRISPINSPARRSRASVLLSLSSYRRIALILYHNFTTLYLDGWSLSGSAWSSKLSLIIKDYRCSAPHVVVATGLCFSLTSFEEVEVESIMSSQHHDHISTFLVAKSL